MRLLHCEFHMSALDSRVLINLGYLDSTKTFLVSVPYGRVLLIADVTVFYVNNSEHTCTRS